MNASELLNRISIHGYAAQIISIKHLPEMESTLNDLKSQGYISPQFYQDELTRYISFDYKSIFPDAMSVIVMADPRCLLASISEDIRLLSPLPIFIRKYGKGL
jgi:hypothetical protein